ncbi:MAG: DNA-3-methyladenine glycosylase I [Paracoccaceae bacterium]
MILKGAYPSVTGALWQKLILNGFQAGLIWITILKKRHSFRLRLTGSAPKQAPIVARKTSPACCPPTPGACTCPTTR